MELTTTALGRTSCSSIHHSPGCSWVLKRCKFVPCISDHTLSTPWLQQLRRRVPQWLHVTCATQSVCPSKMKISCHCLAPCSPTPQGAAPAYTRTVVSRLPLATSADTAPLACVKCDRQHTLYTQLVCVSNVASGSHTPALPCANFSRSKMTTAPELRPAASSRPQGEPSRQRTPPPCTPTKLDARALDPATPSVAGRESRHQNV